MSARRWVVATLMAASLGAQAAELPSHAARTRPEAKAGACEIDGERGIALPGGGCVKLSGYVSVGATGVLRH